MKIKIILCALAFALALPAAAEYRTVQRAYEVELSNLRLPQNEAGTISYKACGDCAFQTTRVSADTVWLLNGRSISLAKFRDGLAKAEVRRKLHVTVLHHLENDRVTKVIASLK